MCLEDSRSAILVSCREKVQQRATKNRSGCYP